VIMVGDNHPGQSRSGTRHDLGHSTTNNRGGTGDLALLGRPRVSGNLRPLQLQGTQLLVQVRRSRMFMARGPLSLTDRRRTYRYDAKCSLMQP